MHSARPDARVVLESDEIARALSRIAHEILEHNKGPQGLVLMGIPTRGVHLAHRLSRRLAQIVDDVGDAAERQRQGDPLHPPQPLAEADQP